MAKFVNVVTNLPNIKSINGSSVPAAIAARKAPLFKVQLNPSAYLNTRC